MKQPKLSFTTRSKRRSEMEDKKDKEPRAKKARQENNLTDIKKDFKKKSSEKDRKEKENICSTKFSSSMKDAVKTLCQLCGLPVTLTAMRGHTKSAHALSIADYKDRYGNHRTQIIERIFHRCGLCDQALLLDSDDIAHHLKKCHNITHKDYNKRFMTLVKDDKLSAESKPQQDRRKDKKAATVPVQTSIKSVEILEEDQDLSGPSSGVRLTEAERQANLCEVFRLQRNLLKKLNLDDEVEPEAKEDFRRFQISSALPNYLNYQN